MDANSLAGLGEGLTKPATVLVEKISDAVGGLYRPRQIRAIAQAEADAARIHTESEIEITALHQRGFFRWVEEVAEQQFNMEEITRKALPLVGEDASPGDMENDWIANFFAKSRGISDSEMQGLWARILAGEANAPGSFSRKTVNLMEDIDAIEAARFVNMCGFSWNIGPIIFDTNDAIYTRKGVSFKSISQIESLGLIHFTGLGAVRQNLPNAITMSYHGRPLRLKFAGEDENKLPIGKVFYSLAGEQIASICNANPVEGFYEYACAKWEAESNVESVQRFPARPVP